MWEKKKLLVTSNFSFSHSHFKRPVLQTCKNQCLFVKGLNECIYFVYSEDHDQNDDDLVLEEKKILCEKEKMLVTIISFL